MWVICDKKDKYHLKHKIYWKNREQKMSLTSNGQNHAHMHMQKHFGKEQEWKEKHNSSRTVLFTEIEIINKTEYIIQRIYFP